LQNVEKRLVLILDGNQLEAYPEIVSQVARIADAVAGRVWTGHADADHVFFPHGVHRYARGESRIDTTAESDNHPLEPAFANVIARAHGERLIHRIAFIGKIVVA